MLYHLDVQLGSFMKFLDGTLGSGRTLYAVSADHGICPIVELLEQQGLTQARRVFISKFVPEMNKLIEEKYGVAGIVQKYKTPQFYVDMKKLKSLDKRKQKAIIKDLRAFLERQQGIKQTWTFKELHNATFKDSDLANFFKQQLFKGRSGLITLQTYPYSLDTKWPYGTDHRTPYDYDTHVPLIIYQPEIFEKKSIDQRVWALQLANTLAYIIGIERPSASTFDLLPGLFDPISPAP
jgi:arylsulfatase A-like enzyme